MLPRCLVAWTLPACVAALAASVVVHGSAAAADATTTPASLLDGASTSAVPSGLVSPLLGSPPTPDQDPFYRLPRDFEGAEPGQLLRFRSSRVYLIPGGLVAAPVRAWQVLYRSTNGRGDADAVSGTVMVPDTPWLGGGPRPIVSYAVGTHGLGDQCAPSYKLATGAESEYIVAMSLALAKGWAVAVTDYEGLGTPGDHAYMVSISAGRAALDIARAAAHLPGAGLAPHAPIALWGYSQGGAATASAAEQAKDYAPELHTVRVAEGGVPADLNALLPSLDGGSWFALLAGVVAGYDTGYPRLGLPDKLNSSGKDLVQQIRHECADQFGQQANHHLDEYTKSPGLLNYPPLERAFDDNALGHHTPRMPVLLYRGQDDQLISSSVTTSC